MKALATKDVRKLVRLLREAGAVAREHAAEQSYRRDAMRSIKEHELAGHHDAQWRAALDLAQRCADQADLLAEGLGGRPIPQTPARSPSGVGWTLTQGTQ